jgi:SnoaL-like protein
MTFRLRHLATSQSLCSTGASLAAPRAMSQENVEIVRMLQPPPDLDLLPLFRDQDIWNTAVDTRGHLFHPSYEVRLFGVGESRRYVGPEGYRQAWLDWLAPWESYRAEIAELIDAGDRVLVITDDYGRRPGMSAEVRLHGAAVWTLRDGKIVAADFYAQREQALEAVGLRE